MHWKGAVLSVTDVLLCNFVFFPCMVCYWRGIWDLTGVYIFPNRVPLNSWMAVLIGMTTLLGYWLYPLAHDFFSGRRHTSPVFYAIGSRLCIFLYAIPQMMLWRGVWSLGDYYMGTSVELAAAFLACCYALLVTFRSTRTLLFSPLIVLRDTREDALMPCTRFRVQRSSHVKYTLDVLFTQCVIMVLVMLCWRNIWCVFDSFWFPDDKTKGDIVALIVGWVCGVTLLALELPFTIIAAKCSSVSFYLRLFWEDLVIAAGFVALKMLWRGGWNLNATYVIADPLVGGWVNFIFGSIALLLLQLMSYAGACGCGIDCMDKTTVTPIWETSYIRHYARSWLDDNVGSYCVENTSVSNDCKSGDVYVCGTSYTLDNNNFSTSDKPPTSPPDVSSTSPRDDDVIKTPMSRDVKRIRTPVSRDVIRTPVSHANGTFSATV